MKYSSEREIVEGLKSGGEGAVQALLERTQVRLYHDVNRFLNNRTASEEVIADTYVKALLRINDFEGNSNLYSWLFRIARNEAVDILRRKKRERRVDGDISDFTFESQQKRPDMIASDREISSRIHDAMQYVPERKRNLLVLYYFEGLSYEEIAGVTNLSIGTVRSGLHHAKRSLADKLQARGITPEIAAEFLNAA